MGRACSTHGRGENSDKILVGKAEGKRPTGRTKGRWGIILELILGKTKRNDCIWLRIGISDRLL
jgi:hypothetical protein